MGIEPTTAAWEATVLPLNYAHLFFFVIEEHLRLCDNEYMNQNNLISNNEEYRKQILGTVLTLLGAALWGSCATVSKYLIGTCGLDTLWMTNFRMLMSGVILIICAAVKRPHNLFDVWKDTTSLPRLFAIGIFGFGICQVGYFLAIRYCNAGLASAIQQTAPVFVLVFVLFKEHRLPKLSELVVLILVIYGSFMIATGGDFGALSISAKALLWGLISAITAALYILLPSKLISKYGTYEVVGWGMIIGALLISPFCKFWAIPSGLSGMAILGLAYIIIPGSVVAFATFLYGTTMISPVKAGIFNLLEPVVATLASLVFLHQAFSIGDYIGIAAILVGIAFLATQKK